MFFSPRAVTSRPLAALGGSAVATLARNEIASSVAGQRSNELAGIAHGMLLARPAHGESVDPQRGLADADRHALPFLAAGADAFVELEVVADHADARQYIGPVADERGALDGRTELAVLDQIGLAGGEHELAGGDIHLAAAEIDGIDTLVHRGDDLTRIGLAGPHVGVGHARQRDVRERLAPPVAGGSGAHEARIHLVL